MPEGNPWQGGEREHGRLPPEDFRSRNRRHHHRLDLDVGAGLISVDLHEHVADAQGRALVMGDDELHLLRSDDPHLVHVSHHCGRTIDLLGALGYTVGIEVIDSELPGRPPAPDDAETDVWSTERDRSPGDAYTWRLRCGSVDTLARSGRLVSLGVPASLASRVLDGLAQECCDEVVDRGTGSQLMNGLWIRLAFRDAPPIRDLGGKFVDALGEHVRSGATAQDPLDRSGRLDVEFPVVEFDDHNLGAVVLAAKCADEDQIRVVAEFVRRSRQPELPATVAFWPVVLRVASGGNRRRAGAPPSLTWRRPVDREEVGRMTVFTLISTGRARAPR